jgi:hypothetical protein
MFKKQIKKSAFIGYDMCSLGFYPCRLFISYTDLVSQSELKANVLSNIADKDILDIL